ncbi:SulP family inorganic anion transporter [Thorsellia anophelis]|uniref:High affinity sulphate transporter 1 n=1 Tax=Thorsellia anophelis DSM 18579 TaxID=1123402 RepID=A0A1I0CKD3_9GAMM|nr:SulP family inorganic anion transporter [Thorsellia anophelis]SET20109.1 high affinity sulphate transporter 1 [Thorsellia anophelis DSM 18579]
MAILNKQYLFHLMPGLANLLKYQRGWFSYDLRAGLSVAAVALPVAIAYAELTGVSPIVGLYACILPMIAYAIFGSSRQLIIGPDAATCAIIAAVVAPLAKGNPHIYLQLVIMMTIMTGIWCLIASKLHLGALADLLSRPILTGLLNGVAITIITGQLSKVVGYESSANQLIERIIELPSDILTTHWPTLATSIVTLLLLLLFKRLTPKLPATLIVMIIMTTLAAFFAERVGIEVTGRFTDKVEDIDIKNFQPGLLRDLLVPSLNLALVSFVSLMLTARSFASKNRYEIDANAEFRALGIANIVSGLSQGFAVSGASSRTAVNDSIGGKTQLVSIIAALCIAFVLFFLTSPLQYIPIPSLGVVLIFATWSLIDFKSIRKLRRRNKEAFMLAVFTVVMVLLVGVIAGIGLAVLVGLMQFLRIIFRPTESLLGADADGRIHTLSRSGVVEPIKDTIIYRFNSPLTYFNVAYFKRRILHLVENENTENQDSVKWVVVDAVSALTHPDVSVIASLKELKQELADENISILLAGRKTELTKWLRIEEKKNSDWLLFPDLYLAVRYIQSIEQSTENEINRKDEGEVNEPSTLDRAIENSNVNLQLDQDDEITHPSINEDSNNIPKEV